MLVIKTDRYTFSENETEGYAFVNYMLDTYEWGGGKVNISRYNGLIEISVEYIIETNELEDFQKYCLTQKAKEEK